MEQQPIPPDRINALITAAKNQRVTKRFLRKIIKPTDTECWLWTGAITGQGHGRFWISDGLVVVAHRFAWLLHDVEARPHVLSDLPEVVAHRCDNPICQNPEHLEGSTPLGNRTEWAQRRHSPGSLLRDTRGALTLAKKLREAALKGESIQAVIDAGMTEGDRLQPTLW